MSYVDLALGLQGGPILLGNTDISGVSFAGRASLGPVFSPGRVLVQPSVGVGGWVFRRLGIEETYSALAIASVRFAYDLPRIRLWGDLSGELGAYRGWLRGDLAEYDIKTALASGGGALGIGYKVSPTVSLESGVRFGIAQVDHEYEYCILDVCVDLWYPIVGPQIFLGVNYEFGRS